jgi:hypothetical protein
MDRHGSGITDGASYGEDYRYSMDALDNFAELDPIENCPAFDIPEWLHEYKGAVDDIGRRLRSGDFEDATPNKLLDLRKRILCRKSELSAVGKRYGYHEKTTHWFRRSDW